MAPNTLCHVEATLRRVGPRRLHATLWVRCASTQLFRRKLRSGCHVTQVSRVAGYRYKIKCSAARIPRSEDDDGNVTQEKPGMVLDTFADPAYARIWKEGPPEVKVRLLMIDALSKPRHGPPLFD